MENKEQNGNIKDYYEEKIEEIKKEEKGKRKTLFMIIAILLFLLCISICVIVWKIGRIGYIPTSNVNKNSVVTNNNNVKEKNNTNNNINNNSNNQINSNVESNQENINNQNNMSNENNEISTTTNSGTRKTNYNSGNSKNNTNSENKSRESINNNGEAIKTDSNSTDLDNNDIIESLDARIEVKQDNLNAELIDDLDIFKNPEFNNQKIIAPSSKGKYNFTVKNSSKNNISYNMKMTEENNWNINLKYKLKQDNIYIVGNKDTWVDVKDLDVKNIISTNQSEHVYTLEWYWEDAENDTEIGEASNVNYNLKININAKGIQSKEEV